MYKNVLNVRFQFLIAEPVQPTLQELCRTTVRHVLITNAYKRHPGLTKVKKRKRKPKKKSPRGALSNLNIVPLSMGMMILQQQFDRSDSEDDSLDGSHDEEGGVNNEDESDKRSMGDMETGDSDADLDKSVTEDGQEGQFSSDEGETDHCDNVAKNGTKNGHNDLESVFNVEDIARKEDGTKKDESRRERERYSDYSSDEEGFEDSQEKTDDLIDTVATANSSTSVRGPSVSQLNDAVANAIDSSLYHANGNGPSIVPPDLEWSDTDSDDHLNPKSYNIEEFLKAGARESKPAKQRYSSTTSVDTSTTSGIGSFVEEHLDAELGRSDSEKTSPGWTNMDQDNCGGCSRSFKSHNMDIEEKAEEEDVEEEESDTDKVTLSKVLKEDIDSLPLPTALKAYLKYYRQ